MANVRDLKKDIN